MDIKWKKKHQNLVLLNGGDTQAHKQDLKNIHIVILLTVVLDLLTYFIMTQRAYKNADS